MKNFYRSLLLTTGFCLSILGCSDNHYVPATPPPAASTAPAGMVFNAQTGTYVPATTGTGTYTSTSTTTTGVLPANSGLIPMNTALPANTSTLLPASNGTITLGGVSSMIGFNSHGSVNLSTGINYNAISGNCAPRITQIPIASNGCGCYTSPCSCADRESNNICAVPLTKRQIRLENRIKRISDREARKRAREKADIEREEAKLADKQAKLKQKDDSICGGGCASACGGSSGCSSYENETPSLDDESTLDTVESSTELTESTYKNANIYSATILNDDAKALYRRLRRKADHDGSKTGFNYRCDFASNGIFGINISPNLVRINPDYQCHFAFILKNNIPSEPERWLGNLLVQGTEKDVEGQPLDKTPEYSGPNLKVGAKAGLSGEDAYVIFTGKVAKDLYYQNFMHTSVESTSINNGIPEPALLKASKDQMLACYHFTKRHAQTVNPLDNTPADYKCIVKVNVGTGAQEVVDVDADAKIAAAEKANTADSSTTTSNSNTSNNTENTPETNVKIDQ